MKAKPAKEKKSPAASQPVKKPTKQEVPWLKWLSPLLCVVAVIAAAIGLLKLEEEFLWKLQELNLHLHTPLFFRQQMVVAGGLLTWLGTWFTEFFYHPATGVAWLCLWWVVLMLLASRAFRVPLKWSIVLLVPVALVLLTVVDMGYWVYYLKLRGHAFVAVMGLSAACALVWAFRSLPNNKWLRPLFVVIATMVGYPLFGFYGLLAALLMGIMGIRLRSYVSTIVAVVAIIAVTLLCYRFVFYQTSLGNTWWAALPLYYILEEHTAYYIP